jgi:methylenetetrahydrofolate reductase (NADPH)
LRELGHGVIVHIAARMVRGREHLDGLLARMAERDVADVFLVGGDASEPVGSYASAVELLVDMRAHRRAPRTIGVAAYPEGHPLIADDVLRADLLQKDLLADYMTTQMCFDPGALALWLEETRGSGVGMPVYLGLPGAVDRRRLLEVSLRVGVGTSISFLRKQHGAGRLFGNVHGTTERLCDAVAPLVGGPFDVAGLHFFTFNRLVETVRLAQLRAGERSSQQHRPAERRSVAIQQESQHR